MSADRSLAREVLPVRRPTRPGLGPVMTPPIVERVVLVIACVPLSMPPDRWPQRRSSR